MREKITLLLVTVATVCACAVFATTLVHAGLYSAPEDVSVPLITDSTSTTTLHPPVSSVGRLIIPSIGVDAYIQSVGLGKTGNMAVPTNYTDVGWYRNGPTPGQIGSAVIDGHVDNGFGMNAVFKHITDIVPGNDIYVESSTGHRLRFVVDAVKTYPVADVPTDLLFDRTDTARLNLITCAGTWSREKKAYDERTVVYATLAE